MDEYLRAILEEQRQWLLQQINDQNQRISEQQQQVLEQQQKHLQDQQQRLDRQHQQMLTRILDRLGEVEEQPGRTPPSNHGGNSIHFNPKVEFPYFDGHDPKGWIKKCIRYFGLCKIPDDQKVDLASLHLQGPAGTWFGSYITRRRGLTWDEFIVDICARFRDNLGSKVVEDFNRLQQIGTLDDYIAK